MFRPTAYGLFFVATCFLYPACEVSVGDGDGDGDTDGGADNSGDGDVGGEGGLPLGTGGSGDGGTESGSGGETDDFIPSAFVPPAGLPVELPEVVRMGGYSADSAELRTIDAFRATYGALNTKLTEGCDWGQDGYDNRVDLLQYEGLCRAACMAEYLDCDSDAEEYVCGYVDSSNASDDLASCLVYCETFVCDDGSSDTAGRCDQTIDCDDASDEKDCGDLGFLCANGEESESGSVVCDGDEDCEDGSDEMDCGHNGFVCQDGARIQAARQCDGAEDCELGEDEEDCAGLVYTCDDGEGIAWYETCDQDIQCADGSDETAGCVKLAEDRCP